MTPPCPPRSQLARLLTDQLDPADDASVAEHIQACASCQALLEELSGGRPALEQAVPGAESSRFRPCTTAGPPTVVEDMEAVIRRLQGKPPGPDPDPRRGGSGQEERSEADAGSLPQIPGL